MENGCLQRDVGRLTVEATEIREEKVRRAKLFQEKLGPLKMELKVSREVVRKSRAVNASLQKDVDQLRDELGKKAYLAQANLRKLIGKFREKTKAEIELTIVEYGHLLTMFTLSISGRAIFVISKKGLSPSLGV
jgi:predicted translin family RNA/ssDNA-binding protein